MKKRLAGMIAAVLVLTVLGSGCTMLGLYPCEAKDVSSCQIVRMEKVGYTVLAEIEDTAAFVGKFLALRRTTFSGFENTDSVMAGDVLIRIEYRNGDYDLIAADKQYVYHPNETQAYANPHFAFDERGFEALIKEYCPEPGE